MAHLQSLRARGACAGLAVLVAIAGCGDTGGDPSEVDAVQVTDAGRPVGEDAGADHDAGTTDDGGAQDAGGDAGLHDADGSDAAAADAGTEDAGPVDGGSADAGSTDAGTADAGFDAGTVDGGQQAGFCRSWDDCAGEKVCDFSLGRCETRDVKPADQAALYAFKPPAGAAGDVLVVDGHRFYKSLFGMLQVKAKIGSAAKTTAGVDENRILIHVASGDTGVVAIIAEGGQTVSGNKLVPTAAGIVPCDGTTPDASGAAGLSVSDAGPYAAGYVDDPKANVRIHYPAECGSVRRPPVKGTYPLVTLLHGNGAGYLNYEYLGQHLATWGFVTVMPEEAEESGNSPLRSRIEGYFNTDLGGVSPVLSGVKTAGKVAHVGHSRGTGRLEDITQSGALADNTVASVFLGPVDNGMKVPRGMFMVFFATGDLQSSEGSADTTYGRQDAPKWKVTINGGNHSLYSDHKVWLGPMSDELPTITRTQQFRTVTSFCLPLFERAFGMTEHFPAQLDAPPPSAAYSVKMDK